MQEIRNPFGALVGGRVAIYLDEAFVEYGRGRVRGAYDYAVLALNTTLYELRPRGKTLFEKLGALEAERKVGPEVLAYARARGFLEKHDRGITDMDLSYMSAADLHDVLGFLEVLYRSLAANGVALTHDPRPS